MINVHYMKASYITLTHRMTSNLKVNLYQTSLLDQRNLLRSSLDAMDADSDQSMLIVEASLHCGT